MRKKKVICTFMMFSLVISLLSFHPAFGQEIDSADNTKTEQITTTGLDKLSPNSDQIQKEAYLIWDKISAGELPFDIAILFDNIFENTSLTDVVIFSIGMVIYGIFIWHFYQIIARRDIVSLGEEKIKTGAKVVSISAYILKYIIVFPLIIFVWFFVYSMFMFFLAPEVEIKFVFMVVISLVIAIRISAYYKEDLARDLAKMIPFAILAIFLSTGVFFTLEQLQDRVSELVPFLLTVVQFVIIAIVVEAILRGIYLIKRRAWRSHKDELETIVGEKVADKIEDMVETEVKEKLGDIDKKNPENKK